MFETWLNVRLVRPVLSVRVYYCAHIVDELWSVDSASNILRLLKYQIRFYRVKDIRLYGHWLKWTRTVRRVHVKKVIGRTTCICVKCVSLFACDETSYERCCDKIQERRHFVESELISRRSHHRHRQYQLQPSEQARCIIGRYMQSMGGIRYECLFGINHITIHKDNCTNTRGSAYPQTMPVEPPNCIGLGLRKGPITIAIALRLTFMNHLRFVRTYLSA